MQSLTKVAVRECLKKTLPKDAAVSRCVRAMAMAPLLLIFCALPAKYVSAQSVDPIQNYLDSAEEAANSVVSNAGAQGRGVAMEAGQALLNAIASFRSAYADSLTLTDTALTGQRAALFKDIQKATNDLQAVTDKSTSDLQSIADTLADTTANIPLTKDIPRVRKVSPIFYSNGDLRAHAKELVVYGIGLANGTPSLEIEGAKITPGTMTDNELRIVLPTTYGSTFPIYLSATLHLFEHKSKYLFFSDFVPKDYPIRLAIYSDEIGVVALTPRIKQSSREQNDVKSGGYSCTSPGGTNAVAIQVQPPQGWLLIPGSVAFHEQHTNYGTHAINSTTPTGFTATLTCTTTHNRPFNPGHHGVEDGYFTYTVYRDVTALVNASAISHDLKWGDSFTVTTLPENTQSVVLELTSPFGDHLSLVDKGENSFLAFEFDRANDTALVSSKSIDQSFHR